LRAPHAAILWRTFKIGAAGSACELAGAVASNCGHIARPLACEYAVVDREKPERAAAAWFKAPVSKTNGPYAGAVSAFVFFATAKIAETEHRFWLQQPANFSAARSEQTREEACLCIGVEELEGRCSRLAPL